MISRAFSRVFPSSNEYGGKSTNNSNPKTSSKPTTRNKAKIFYRHRGHTKNSSKASTDDPSISSVLSYFPSMPNLCYQAPNTLPPKNSPIYLALYKQTLDLLTNDGAYGIDKMPNKWLKLNKALRRAKHAKTLKALKNSAQLKLTRDKLSKTVATKEMERTALLEDNSYELKPLNDSLTSGSLSGATTTLALSMYLGRKIAKAAIKHSKWLVVALIASQVQLVSADVAIDRDLSVMTAEQIKAKQAEKAKVGSTEEQTKLYEDAIEQCCLHNSAQHTDGNFDKIQQHPCIERLMIAHQKNAQNPFRKNTIEICVANTINAKAFEQEYLTASQQCASLKSARELCEEKIIPLKNKAKFARQCSNNMLPENIQNVLLKVQLHEPTTEPNFFKRALTYSRLIQNSHSDYNMRDHREIQNWNLQPKHFSRGYATDAQLEHCAKILGGRFKFDKETGAVYTDSGFSMRHRYYPYSDGNSNVLIIGDPTSSPDPSIKANAEKYINKAVSDYKAGTSNPFYSDASEVLSCMMPTIASIEQAMGKEITILGQSMAGTAAVYAATQIPTNDYGFELNVQTFSPLPLTSTQLAEILKKIKSTGRAELIRDHIKNIFLEGDMIPWLGRVQQTHFLGRRWWIKTDNSIRSRPPIKLHLSVGEAMDKEYIRRQTGTATQWK